ncbi:MAG: hypothetical protein HC869_22295 [Rhodospirillales bacterium]|nr:hypothetical protein [Rhodospirillales bacterium]
MAALAFVWQFFLFQPNGPVWALFLLTPLVPLIDWIWPGKKHVWQTQARPADAEPAGVGSSADGCELAPSPRPRRGQNRSQRRARRDGRQRAGAAIETCAECADLLAPSKIRG